MTNFWTASSSNLQTQKKSVICKYELLFTALKNDTYMYFKKTTLINYDQIDLTHHK